MAKLDSTTVYGDLNVTAKLNIDGDLGVGGDVTVGATPAYEVFSVQGNISLSNELTFSPEINGTATGYINYDGYAANNTQFRNLNIMNGKRSSVMCVDGTNSYVGIGITPTSKLQVLSGVASRPVATFSGNGTAGTYIELDESGTKGWFIGIDNGTSTLNFREDSVTGTVGMSLDNGSNLSVAGDLTVNGNNIEMPGAAAWSYLSNCSASGGIAIKTANSAGTAITMISATASGGYVRLSDCNGTTRLGTTLTGVDVTGILTASVCFSGSGAGLTGTAASLTAGNATNLANIPTTFTGNYPMTVNVNGSIYSNTGINYCGNTNTLATSILCATSYVRTGYLCGTSYIRAGDSTGTGILLYAGSCVVLLYNNSQKIKTLNDGACVTGTGYATDWIASSDCRLKTSIEPISNALSTVNKLCGIYYCLCDDKNCEKNIGFIAQDVVNILPEVVSYGEPSEEDQKNGITDERLGLKYNKITAVLVEAVKELTEQNKCLQNQINELKIK